MNNSDGSDSTRGGEEDPLRHLHGGDNEPSASYVELLKSIPTVDNTNIPPTDADIQWHQRHAGRTHLPSHWTDKQRRAIELDAFRGVMANEAEYRQILKPGCRHVLDELKNADTDQFRRLIHTLHDCIRNSGDTLGLAGACESWPSPLRGTSVEAGHTVF